MSWKATAFVKDLRDGLTVTEKFVLLMLAEYHRTDDRLSWPSVSTLAGDCLMEEESVRKILGRLVEKSFITRQLGGGRGNMNAYQFVGLDVKKGDSKRGIPETGFIETPFQTPFVQPLNPLQPCQPNKEARVFTGTQGEVLPNEPTIETPNGLHPLQYAARLMLEINMPDTRSNLEFVAAGIRSEARNLGGLAAAYDYVLTETLAAISEGIEITNFWFSDAKWRTWRNNGRGFSKAAAKSARIGRHIVDGIEKDISNSIGLDGAKQQERARAATRNRI